MFFLQNARYSYFEKSLSSSNFTRKYLQKEGAEMKFISKIDLNFEITRN